MIRNVTSVVAGYALWTLIYLGGGAAIRSVRAGVHDENGLTSDVPTLLMYLLLSVIASFAGGFAAYMIAQSRESACTGVLAVCLLATGIPVQVSAWSDLPVWYHLSFLILLVPITLVGARLASGRKHSPSIETDAA